MLTRINPICYSTLALSLLVSVLFFLTYLNDQVRPGVVYKNGWFEVWHDQSVYATMARKIYLLDFTPSGMEYPLGYPLIGAVFYRINPIDPFLLPNYLLFVSSIMFIYLSFWKFFESNKKAMVAIFFILLSTPIIKISEIPWTTNVTFFSSALAFYTIISRYNVFLGIISSLTAGYAFFTRFADGIILFPILFFNLFRSPCIIKKNIKGMLLHAMATFVPFFFVVQITFYANQNIFGNPFGNYIASVQKQGFDSPINLIYKFFGIFINPYQHYKESHVLALPIVQQIPILLLSPLGLYYFIKNKKDKFILLSLASVILIWIALYLPFAGFSPLSLKNGSIHYIKIIFPPLMLFSIYGLYEFTNLKNKQLIIYPSLLILIILLTFLLPPKEIDKITIDTESNVNNITASNIIDNDIQTRWDTKRPQNIGDEVIFDFKKQTKILGLTIDTSNSPQGCPNHLIIEKSNDKIHWDFVEKYEIESGACEKITKFFITKKFQYLRLKTIESDAKNWWSIHEVYFYQ